VDDADALHDQIVAAGGVIIQPLSDGGFGRQFSFQDPDGYTIVAHQNP
jgi:predicted enzyme related to lactoylglutathione lyase